MIKLENLIISWFFPTELPSPFQNQKLAKKLSFINFECIHVFVVAHSIKSHTLHIKY